MSRADAYVDFVREKMRLLSRFRELAPSVLSVVKRVLSEYGVDDEIFFFGSIVDGKYTAASDVDIAVVVREVPRNRSEIAGKIVEELEKIGVPSWFPLEIHFLTPDLFEALRRGGANFVRAEDFVGTANGANEK
ncbi:nucleotidyltransferase domain-containing protein [Thermofilum pendens]|uniref:DNA polymerase, beta domain protein region n=1 Tax=Thermofilum pendens (strain DSM 2475 / Hrk 5) TaxID=368408 RepID=A1S050_THEPD|nr:nucleotidyltransferase domain-containing protein [Thermofilum pendens]ABL78830.1 DNA polymerase, beta domain protein region [Thermofilum pendens Hrk 5]